MNNSPEMNILNNPGYKMKHNNMINEGGFKCDQTSN